MSRDNVASTPHVPVLLSEVVDALSPADDEIYIDGTFGAGGYSRAILEAANCRVIAIDRDPTAVATARIMADEFAPRLTALEGCYSEMDVLVENIGEGYVDGVALDVGVSSMQIDQAERGFSFQQDGPLDMRMGAEGETAADVVNSRTEAELANIIFELGEDRKSRRIARAIVAAREEAPIERTSVLARIVAGAVGHKKSKSGRSIHPATRTFQALRIYVNDELGELSRGLEAAERCLAPEGRLCVVTFHSLEDRIAKNFLAERSGRAPGGSRHRPPSDDDKAAPTFRVDRARAIKPGEAEIETNPRARSARLRVAIRTAEPARKNLGGNHDERAAQ